MSNNSKEILQKFGEKLIQAFKDNIDNAGATASGDSARSLEVFASESELLITGTKHIPVLERGRKPGKRPPISAIEAWLEHKKIPFENEIKKKSLAYAIAVSIGKKGTKLFQEGGRDNIFTQELNEKTLDQLENEISEYFSTLITTSIVDVFNKDTNKF